MRRKPPRRTGYAQGIVIEDMKPDLDIANGWDMITPSMVPWRP